jgi:hypothetical protein
VAKKKAQVPTPPRTPKSPASGSAASRKATPSSRRTKLVVWAVVGVLVVAAAAVGIVIALSSGGGGAEPAAAAADTSCTREDFPSMGRQHVETLKSDFTYNSTPATSGPHYPIPAVWNVYGEPVEEIRLVHNLEHGGVIVQYGDQVPQTTVDEILAWYQPDPNGVIVAPKPELGADIALTAWTHLMTCTNGFEEAAFSSFRDDYRFKGPEAFPPQALAPGNQ